jgi:hypothetical protein
VPEHAQPGLKHDDALVRNVRDGMLARWTERVRNIFLRNPDPASRAYRYMARLIHLEFGADANGVCLAFTSPDSDQASTDALLMLAYCLHSELDSRVLIVDARLKDQAEGVTGRLGLLHAPGFAELLLERAPELKDLIQSSALEGVDVLPAGDPGGGRATPMDREKLQQLLALARDSYDHVLMQVGSPARDTRALMTAAEAKVVFLLVEENQTFMKNLDECRKILLSNGLEDIRVVVTGSKS